MRYLVGRLIQRVDSLPHPSSFHLHRLSVPLPNLNASADSLDVCYDDVNKTIGPIDSAMTRPGNAWTARALTEYTHLWDVLDKHRESVKTQLGELSELLRTTAARFKEIDDQNAEKTDNLLSGLGAGGLDLP